MLVLSRKAGETIRIGEDVVITVQRIGGNRVSIGVEAPRSVPVWRGELPAAAGSSFVIGHLKPPEAA